MYNLSGPPEKVENTKRDHEDQQGQREDCEDGLFK